MIKAALVEELRVVHDLAATNVLTTKILRSAAADGIKRVAPTADVRDGWVATMQHRAMEAGSKCGAAVPCEIFP